MDVRGLPSWGSHKDKSVLQLPWKASAADRDLKDPRAGGHGEEKPALLLDQEALPPEG